jgi:hypothetical protein
MKRIERLERLGQLFQRVEQMREQELHTASRAVSEIVNLQAEEAAASEAEVITGRMALAAGDPQEWMLAEAGRELIGLRMSRHSDTRVRREEERSAAHARFSQQRLEREQMGRLIEAQRRTTETVESRRLQASTDDRFLSRREWLRVHGPRPCR